MNGVKKQNNRAHIAPFSVVTDIWMALSAQKILKIRIIIRLLFDLIKFKRDNIGVKYSFDTIKGVRQH